VNANQPELVNHIADFVRRGVGFQNLGDFVIYSLIVVECTEMYEEDGLLGFCAV
jgi:hypothetical protein